MERDKIVLQKRTFSGSRNVRVRINDEAADIVNDLWLKTGLSATEIVSRMIIFAADHTTIEGTAFDD